jgi:hypothetical protein
MNSIVFKELINDFIDNIDEMRLTNKTFYDNYKSFIYNNNLKIEEQKDFTNQLIKHFQLDKIGNVLYSDSFSTILIEMLNEELNKLNQKEITINDSSNDDIEVLKNNEKKNRIQLKCTQNSIAYLFYVLRKNEIIECQNLAKALSNIFINEEGKPITNFNSCFKKFNQKEYPSKANIIDVFVKDFKKV